MAHLDGFEAESYLKSGANELRVLEYNVCGHAFGINILKVKKIVSHMNQFMSMPESHPAIRGVFEDRGTVVPLIDLAYFLSIPRSDEEPPQKVIITEFFEMTNGFWVDRIDWIHHFKWEDVIDPTKVMHGFDQRYVIGIVKPSEDRMVLLLDYENIIMDISPQLRQVANSQISKAAPVVGGGRHILVAEDSPAVRTMLASELEDLGFEVLQARDGKEALDALDKYDGSLDLIISDVEMPRMDGLALTVAVRGSKFRNTPVIVYSSIGDIGMKARAKFLKANAHITKLNFDQLIEQIGELIGNEPKASPAVEIQPETETPETGEEVEAETASRDQAETESVPEDKPEDSMVNEDQVEVKSENEEAPSTADTPVPEEEQAGDPEVGMSAEEEPVQTAPEESVAETEIEAGQFDDDEPMAQQENSESDQETAEQVSQDKLNAEAEPEKEQAEPEQKQPTEPETEAVNDIADTIKSESEQVEKAVEEGISGSMGMMPSIGQDEALMTSPMPDINDKPVEKAVEDMAPSTKSSGKAKKSSKSTRSKAKTGKAKEKSTKAKSAKSKADTKTKSSSKKKSTRSKKNKKEEVFV